jgi:hypothetical protein
MARALPARHVLFTTLFATAAIGSTLFGTARRYATAPPEKFPEARTGLGHIVALHHRSINSYQVRSILGTSVSEAPMRPNPRH